MDCAHDRCVNYAASEIYNRHMKWNMKWNRKCIAENGG